LPPLIRGVGGIEFVAGIFLIDIRRVKRCLEEVDFVEERDAERFGKTQKPKQFAFLSPLKTSCWILAGDSIGDKNSMMGRLALNSRE
jgi:hypothetical protein